MRRRVSLLGATATVLLACVAPAAPDVAAPPTGGLVLHYPMETLTGGVVDDAAGPLDGRVVAASGAPRLAPGLPGYGRALQLTGSGHQYVDVPRSTALDVDRYTLSAWVRHTGAENDLTLGRWEVLEKAGAYWMNVRTDGRVRVGGFFGGCTNPSWQYLDSTVAIPVGRWKHLTSTYDGSWLRVFVDGRPVGAKQVGGRTCVSGEPLAVGAKNNPTKGLLEAFWDGRLDDVRVYDRALGLAEIRRLAARP